jgi:glycosyltransferase involved in cell wall biosynthesis
MLPLQSSPSRSRRRALFIAYTFPPVGGAGVQRTTKFVKYLPQFGWDASVLSVSNPSVPLRDESLCHDIPAGTPIVRARTLEPSYAAKAALVNSRVSGGSGIFKQVVRRAVLGLLQPDPQILWNGPAFLRGLRALRETRHDVIIASAPPFSSLLLGAALGSAAGVPLVLDYRDEWAISSRNWENRQLRGPSIAIQRAMEHYGLRRARAVIATSPRSAAALHRLCRQAGGSASVTHIFNGFDPDDFLTAPAPRAADAAFRIVYTGTLYKLMSPEPLVAAVEALASERPDLARRLELVFAGRQAAAQAAQLAPAGRLCRLRTLEYVTHPEAIALMRSADALCLLVSDIPGADRIIPAKLFEYIASRKPILAVAPPGDVWQVLRSHPAVFVCTPQDAGGIRAWLCRALERGIRFPDASPFDATPFNRREQARQLASLLHRIAGDGREHPSVPEEVACSA